MRALFWLLAVIVLLNLNNATHLFTGTPSVFKPVLAFCSVLLILIGLLKVPLNRALGVPGALVIATLGSYLIIASTVSLTTNFGPGWNAWEHFEDYTSSIILILAAALGGYSVMRIIGSESLLKIVLVFLTVDCIAILATPVLSEYYVIPGLSAYRFLGNFKNPNVAGFIGCLTAVLALSFLQVRRHRWFAYLALTLAVGATVGTFSRAAFLILIFILTDFFFFNHRGRATVVKWLSVAIPTGVIFLMVVDLDPYFLEQRWQRLSEIATLLPGYQVSDSSLSERQELLVLALGETANSPLFGNGLGTIHSLENAPYNSRGKPQGAHNQYLILAGEAGIIPLVLFLLFLGSLLRLRLMAPRSVVRDAVVGWAIVIGLGCMVSHNILAMRIVDFLIGLSCATVALYWRVSNWPHNESRSVFSAINQGRNRVVFGQTVRDGSS